MGKTDTEMFSVGKARFWQAIENCTLRTFLVPFYLTNCGTFGFLMDNEIIMITWLCSFITFITLARGKIEGSRDFSGGKMCKVNGWESQANPKRRGS